MTRLNLPQTCLLDLSGELGQNARKQLHEHIAKYPAALLEYEVLRGNYDLLRSLPKAEISDERQKFLAGQIKQGIHRKLRENERKIVATKRWRIVYHALAGASALAACLVVYASVNYMIDQVNKERQQAIANAKDHVRDYLDTGSANLTDYAYNNMADQIQSAADGQAALSTQGVSGRAMQKLQDDLDDSLPPGAANEPGSL